jgi:predicted lipopolysaccharide heptosyltransferase III
MRILLIRLREIGDVVFTTPAIRAVRQQFPKAHISYVVEPLAAPVVERNPHLNDVIVVPKRKGARGVLDEIHVIRALRASHYDLAIDFHSGPRSSLMAWLSGASVRVGYDVPGRGWMYTTRVARPRDIRARHAVENQFDLLNAIGIPTPDPTYSPAEMIVETAAAAAVHARLASIGVRSDDELIVIHVSAGNPFRRWPPDAFASLISMLLRGHPRRRVVVVAGPSDRDAAARVIGESMDRADMPDRNRIVSADFTLAELRALMDRAALYIGGDSGPMHIASTSTVPIVALYGPTLPVRSQPWRAPQWPSEAAEMDGLPCRPCNQRTCEPGDFRCLTRLTPEQVIQAAERALDRAAAIGSH